MYYNTCHILFNGAKMNLHGWNVKQARDLLAMNKVGVIVWYHLISSSTYARHKVYPMRLYLC